MADLSIGDLFPPPGHRYLTEERIEELRQEAMSGNDISARTVMELVCDWSNAAAETADLVAEVERLRAILGSCGGFLAALSDDEDVYLDYRRPAKRICTEIAAALATDERGEG